MTYYIPNDNDGNPRTDVILGVTDQGIHLWIPVDPENSDYQRYLEWVAEGNSPLSWPPQ